MVVTESRFARDGKFVEQIGGYHPLGKPFEVKIDKERALYWLRVGAKPTETALKLLQKEGVWDEYEKSKPPKKPRRKPKVPRKREK